MRRGDRRCDRGSQGRDVRRRGGWGQLRVKHRGHTLPIFIGESKGPMVDDWGTSSHQSRFKPGEQLRREPQRLVRSDRLKGS